MIHFFLTEALQNTPQNKIQKLARYKPMTVFVPECNKKVLFYKASAQKRSSDQSLHNMLLPRMACQ